MWLLNEMQSNLLSEEIGQHGRENLNTVCDTSVTKSQREVKGPATLLDSVSLTGFGVAQFWGPISASLA